MPILRPKTALPFMLMPLCGIINKHKPKANQSVSGQGPVKGMMSKFFSRKGQGICRLIASVCLTLAASGALAAPPVDRATQAGLAPHKALYEIKMIANHSNSQFQNLSGQMYYQWQPTCDAWMSSHRFNLVYEYTDTPAMRITSDYSTYEPFDGKSMTFTSQRRRDGELFEELRGGAQIGGEPGERPEAVYTIPENLTFALTDETLFPMSHTLTVLEKIREGKKFFRSAIFDGSDQDGPMQVTSFVGKPVPPDDLIKVSAGVDDKLLRTKAWNVRLAFFPLNKEDAGSDYEMNVVFHENGLISDIIIEYHDFTVSQKLVALEPLESTCGAAAGGASGSGKEDKLKPDQAVKKP